MVKVMRFLLNKKAVYDEPFIHNAWKGSNSILKLKHNLYYWDKKNFKLLQINYLFVKGPSTAYNLFQLIN